MKSRNIRYIILYCIIPILLVSQFYPQIQLKSSNNQNSIYLSNSGISNYNILQNITYQVETNFSIQQLSGSGNYYLKFAKLNNKTPDSSLMRFSPPYQKSFPYDRFIQGNNPSDTDLDHQDRFNNTYDSFNISLGAISNPEFNYVQKYNITLNEIAFDNIEDSEIGDYNYSDVMFDLYCNNSVENYNVSDPILIEASNNIVQGASNVVEKARKIIQWIRDNIVYEATEDEDRGASWAYENKKGDCSEFASLMVTLLRIQNIPARKVSGYLISNNPRLRPSVGQTWTFRFSKTQNGNFLGHAWVEYYVPNIGWIACDPTWFQSDTTYFNYIDFLRFNFNVGQWFYCPPSDNRSEFPNPSFQGSYSGDIDYEYQFKVTVLEANLEPQVWIYFLAIGLPIILILAIVSYLIVRRRKKSRELVYY